MRWVHLRSADVPHEEYELTVTSYAPQVPPEDGGEVCLGPAVRVTAAGHPARELPLMEFIAMFGADRGLALDAASDAVHDAVAAEIARTARDDRIDKALWARECRA